MRDLPQDRYDALKAEIKNHDVPKLIVSALVKQLGFVIPLEGGMDGALLQRVNIFKLFIKQYNTVLRLAQGVSYVTSPDISYLDVTSIFTLIRSCHERYLSFWFLSTPVDLWGGAPEQELHFRWLCFRHGGYVDELKTFGMTGRLQDISQLEEYIRKVRLAKSDILGEIRTHPIFSKLGAEAKAAIEYDGAWKIGRNGPLSWSELAKLSPLNSGLAQREYFTMCLYTHTGYRGIELDGGFRGSINDGLVYLYTVASMFVFELDALIPGAGQELTDRELAIVRELREVGMHWLALPPISERTLNQSV